MDGTCAGSPDGKDASIAAAGDLLLPAGARGGPPPACGAGSLFPFAEAGISLDAGLSADAVRLALAGHAVPRAKTLAALAKSLGVDVRVLTGDLRIPDPGAHPR